MKIMISSVPHGVCRNESVGDYGGRFPSDCWIKVSRTGDWRMDFCIAAHELVEFALCSHRGIKNKDILAFDRVFEASRCPGSHVEPGDDPKAPYKAEHAFATRIERLMVEELGINCEEYEAKVDSL